MAKNRADNILKGKQWNRAFHAHKLTFEALWRMFWPVFKEWSQENYKQISPEIEAQAGDVANIFEENHVTTISDTLADLYDHIDEMLEVLMMFDINKDKPTICFGGSI